MVKKKIWPNFQNFFEVFTQNFSICSQIYGFGIRDPRFGIRKKPIPDPGSMGQKGTGSWIRNTGANGGGTTVWKIIVMSTCDICSVLYHNPGSGALLNPCTRILDT
jgi:hypothetical protein